MTVSSKLVMGNEVHYQEDVIKGATNWAMKVKIKAFTALDALYVRYTIEAYRNDQHVDTKYITCMVQGGTFEDVTSQSHADQFIKGLVEWQNDALGFADFHYAITLFILDVKQDMLGMGLKVA